MRKLNFVFGALCLLFVATLAGCDNGPSGVTDSVSETTASDAVNSEGNASDGQPAQTADGSSGDDIPGSEAASVSYPSDITDLILVTGQSNALGADTVFDSLRDVPNNRVFAYTNEGWRVADLHQVWDLNWHPRNDPDTDPSNNFGFHFAKKLAERRPQRVVGFILVTAPGEGIDHWDYESDFYLKIRNKVVAAINELPSKASIDGILWHQGETDWLADDYYRNKLRDVIANFRSENWFAADKPFICGETVEAPVNQILMALNTDGDPSTGCVSSDGLSTILDKLHFSAEGLRILGTRYTTKYIQMIEQ